MRAVDTIIRKRDGHSLTQAEIDAFVSGLANGDRRASCRERVSSPV